MWSPANYRASVTALRRDYSARKSAALRIFANASLCWPSPIARDHKSTQAGADTHSKNSRPLSEAAGLWATVIAHDSVKGKTPEQVAAMRARTGAGVKNLNEQAPQWASEMWATITAADVEGGRKARSGARSAELLINGQALQFAPLAQTTPKPGAKSRKAAPALSPWFTEWLMAWPIGWTESGLAETALSRWSLLMRSRLSALAIVRAASQPSPSSPKKGR
jgi:hypothetical protein